MEHGHTSRVAAVLRRWLHPVTSIIAVLAVGLSVGCSQAAAPQGTPAVVSSEAPTEVSAPAEVIESNTAGHDLAADAVTPYLGALISGNPDDALALVPEDRRTDDMEPALQRISTALQGCDSANLNVASTRAVPEDTVTATFTTPCGSLAALQAGGANGPVGVCTVAARIEIGLWVPVGVPQCTGVPQGQS